MSRDDGPKAVTCQDAGQENRVEEEVEKDIGVAVPYRLVGAHSGTPPGAAGVLPAFLADPMAQGEHRIPGGPQPSPAGEVCEHAGRGSTLHHPQTDRPASRVERFPDTQTRRAGLPTHDWHADTATWTR